MKSAYTWGGILVVVFASVVGDILLARAMKQVGDVHALWRRAGLWTVVGRILGNSNFFLAWRPWRSRSSVCCSRSHWGECELGRSCRCVAHLHRQCICRENLPARKS